jgi:hypothetical protein
MPGLYLGPGNARIMVCLVFLVYLGPGNARSKEMQYISFATCAVMYSTVNKICTAHFNIYSLAEIHEKVPMLGNRHALKLRKISFSNALDMQSTRYAIYKLNRDKYLPEEATLDTPLVPQPAQYRMPSFLHASLYRALICKRLRSPRIDSKVYKFDSVPELEFLNNLWG